MLCNAYLWHSTTSSGGWVSDGIITEIIDNFTVKCLSNHLTSFAVLVDVAGTHSSVMNGTIDPELLALSWVSYIGCGISALCLTATIIFLLSFR